MYQAASKNCAWKGRRGSQLARGAAKEKITKLAQCWTFDDDVKESYRVAGSADAKASMKAMEESLLARLCQLLTANVVDMYEAVPYKLLIIFVQKDADDASVCKSKEHPCRSK